jgi:hypothetical protein
VGTAGGIGGSTEGCDVCAEQIPQSARFAAMAATHHDTAGRAQAIIYISAQLKNQKKKASNPQILGSGSRAQQPHVREQFTDRYYWMLDDSAARGGPSRNHIHASAVHSDRASQLSQDSPRVFVPHNHPFYTSEGSPAV